MANDLAAKADLELELGPVDIDLAAKIDLLGNDLKDKIEALERAKPRARYQTVYGAGTIPAGGITSGGASLAVDNPPAGRLWLVQWVAVFPAAAPFTPVANLNAIICVGTPPVGAGGQMPSAIRLNPADMVIPAQAVPSSVDVPSKVAVDSQQSLYAILAGTGLGAAGTVYMLCAGVLDVPDKEEVYFW